MSKMKCRGNFDSKIIIKNTINIKYHILIQPNKLFTSFLSYEFDNFNPQKYVFELKGS